MAQLLVSVYRTSLEIHTLVVIENVNPIVIVNNILHVVKIINAKIHVLEYVASMPDAPFLIIFQLVSVLKE